MSLKDLHQYDDIIGLAHPVSKKHPPMAAIDRAAQFSPFAALTGYEVALQKTLEQAIEKVEHEVEAVSFEEIFFGGNDKEK